MSTAAAWPQLCLGCGNFGGIGSAVAFIGAGADEAGAFAIMDAAAAAGIEWFDTADAYGGGASERFIGAWRASRNPARLALTTKVFHPVGRGATDRGLAPERIRRALKASLARLGVERVELYLAHEPDPETPLGASIEAFEQLREQGLIGAWGLSNIDAAGLREALAYATPALVQNSYSLLDRGDEAELLPLCAEHGVAYVPFGPLAGGWLTGKYTRAAPYPDGSRMTMRPEPYLHLAREQIFAGLERLQAEADRLGVELATLAFAWVLSNPAVSGAVCGPSRASHLAPVLAATSLRLDSETRERIGSLFS